MSIGLSNQVAPMDTSYSNAGNSKILRENSLIEPIIKNPFVHKLVLTKADKLKV